MSKEAHNNVYEYKYINGLQLNKCLIDDSLFLKTIKMLTNLFQKGYWVWDCRPNNIIVKNKRLYFVDIGGIGNAPYDYFLLLINDFEDSDCPEEVKSIGKENRYGTESFVIFYFADQLLRFCSLSLSEKYETILKKMHSNLIKDRFASFSELLLEMNCKM